MEHSFLTSLSRLMGGRSAAGQASAVATSTTVPTTRGEPSNKIAYLSAMRIFRDLSPDEMKMIDASTVMTTARKYKIIYMPGESGEILFFLKKGSVHLYRLSSEGRKLIIQTVGPMTFFGEMAVVGQQMYDLFAEAAEECTVCVMRRPDVERLILSKPKVALRMLEEIGQRMHDVQKRLSDSAFKSVPARLASLLLNLSDNGGHAIKGIRHQDLADMLGTYRETVSDSLGELRDEGIIELGRKEISVDDLEALREKAEEERKH
jgi:CRP/FNR family transcriptional regulator, cyclic AMP receptor protein